MTPSSIEITERYLSFFRAHGHYELPGSPLTVPGSSTSFVIAGMQPLLPYLRAEVPPPETRLTGLQRCLRTDDVETVGLKDGKNTSFFMLGNWSIGDYDKRQAITFAYTVLQDVLEIDLDKIWVTVFAGDPENMLLLDEVAVEQWQSLGIPAERIVPLGPEDNFWTMNGPGPCGPDSEIFVDRGEELGCGAPTCRPGCECNRFLEFWNLVFMEYEQLPNGSLRPLPLRCIDTGMGLERMALMLQQQESVFSIDLFQPAQARLSELAPQQDGRNVERRARRMIVDHVRAALFAWLSGVGPGRDGRNSVVRRLLRRAARQGRLLGLNEPFLYELVQPLAHGHGSLLTTEEHRRIPDLLPLFLEEERQFSRVLTAGLRLLTQLEPVEKNIVSGRELFKLQAERGFPADLAAEILEERGLHVSWSEYDGALEEHRQISRQSLAHHFHTV